MTGARAARLVPLGSAFVAVLAVGTLAYLLYAFPYNGLYGVDAYAYAGQSEALLLEMTGSPPRPGTLFSSSGLAHWPVGYHLHLILGGLVAGDVVSGGWMITIALTAAVPLLTYLLIVRLAGFLSPPAQSAAGIVGAGSLLIAPTFTRTGTSLMSDAPAMFWMLLGCVIVVWRWPPPGTPTPRGREVLWAAAAGAALGVAALVRYPSLLVVVPLVVYLLLRWVALRRPGSPPELRWRSVIGPALGAVIAFTIALTPQACYLLTHDPGPEAGGYFTTVTVGNVLSRSSTGPDGREDFAHTMLEFYVLAPVLDGPGGFLPLVFLPFLLAGIAALAQRRMWAVLAFLGTWWLLPALAFATTPYQVHRFVLSYLPAIVAFVGIGAGSAVELILTAAPERSPGRSAVRAAVALTTVLLLAVGGVQGLRSVRSWQATHAAWQASDKALAQSVLAVAGPGGRAICLPSCFSVDYYARVPVLDMYNNGEAALADFIRPRETAAAVSEGGLTTQWAGTPVQRRWDWLARTYRLQRTGTSGDFTIYRVESR